MGALQNAMRDYMETRGYAVSTIQTYLSCMRIFARHYGRSPLQISSNEIEGFFLFLRHQNKSDSTIHLYYESLKLFYRINRIPDRLPHIAFRPVRNKVPKILSQKRVVSMLDGCRSLKYRTMFSLAYSSGIRTFELRNLQVSDIDLERKQVFIRRGKNKKSRYTIIGEKAVTLLRTYINVYKPHAYLFYNQQDGTKPMNRDAISHAFKKMLAEHGEDCKDYHLHTLRHCFATHLVENGTSIFHVMHLLGHSKISTTLVYLHMQDLDELNIESPLDSFHYRRVQTEGTQRQLFAQCA